MLERDETRPPAPPFCRVGLVILLRLLTVTHPPLESLDNPETTPRPSFIRHPAVTASASQHYSTPTSHPPLDHHSPPLNPRHLTTPHPPLDHHSSFARPSHILRSTITHPPLDHRSSSTRPSIILHSTITHPPLDLCPYPVDYRSPSARPSLLVRSTITHPPLDHHSPPPSDALLRHPLNHASPPPGPPPSTSPPPPFLLIHHPLRPRSAHSSCPQRCGHNIQIALLHTQRHSTIIPTYPPLDTNSSTARPSDSLLRQTRMGKWSSNGP